jgi:hypothetical protein
MPNQGISARSPPVLKTVWTEKVTLTKIKKTLYLGV